MNEISVHSGSEVCDIRYEVDEVTFEIVEVPRSFNLHLCRLVDPASDPINLAACGLETFWEA